MFSLEENSNQTTLQNKVSEDVSKDIQEIIQVIEAYKVSWYLYFLKNLNIKVFVKKTISYFFLLF